MKDAIYGVILAAGQGTRMGLSNQTGGKVMAMVQGEPLLSHSIKKLAAAGITQIALVVNPENKQFLQNYADDGQAWQVHLTYVVQERPWGIAHALGLCQSFTQQHKIALLLADNLFEAGITDAVQRFAANGSGAKIFLSKVKEPQEYGVAVIRQDQVIRLVEKPKQWLSDWAVTGVYLYDATVYERIKGLLPSQRGELEITDVNQRYLEAGELTWEALPGWWVDVGTPERLALAESYLQTAQGL